MLVLTRKVGEMVQIEGIGEVHIVRVRGDNVRIGFNIDKDFRIVRGEKLPIVSPVVEPPAEESEQA